MCQRLWPLQGLEQKLCHAQIWLNAGNTDIFEQMTGVAGFYCAVVVHGRCWCVQAIRLERLLGGGYAVAVIVQPCWCGCDCWLFVNGCL